MKKLLLITTCLVFIASCASRYDANSSYKDVLPPPSKNYSSEANSYLNRAQNGDDIQSLQYKLQAAELFLRNEQIEKAKPIIAELDSKNVPSSIKPQLIVVKAKIALLEQQPETAIKHLNQIDSYNLPATLAQVALQTESQAYERLGNHYKSAVTRVQLQQFLSNPQEVQFNNRAIWDSLSQISVDYLRQAASSAHGNSSLNGWVKLAYISKKHASDVDAWITALDAWQAQFPSHPGNQILSSRTSAVNQIPSRFNQVALILPLSSDHSYAAKAIRDGLMSAYYKEKAQGKNVPAIRVYDSGNEQQIAQVYKTAVAEGAELVIGPLTKDGVANLAASGSLPVPALALNSINNNTRSQGIVQFGLNPEDEAAEVAVKAWLDGHRRALILVPNDAWGQRMLNVFTSKWQSFGGVVADVSKFQAGANLAPAIRTALKVDVSEQRASSLSKALGAKLEFEPSRRQDIDVILLASSPEQARQIKPLLQFYFAGSVPVYAPSSIYSGHVSPQSDRDLNDIAFCDMPWFLSSASSLQAMRQQVAQTWPNSYAQYPRLYALGIDSFNLMTDLKRLLAFPELGYPGVTGKLILDGNNKIYRQLNWAKFKQGKPEAIAKQG